MSETLKEELLETWRIHNRINIYLLASIRPDALGDVSASKGRTIAEQFAHIHNVRLAWIKPSAPEVAAKLDKIEKGRLIDKQTLQDGLKASSGAIEELLRRHFESGERIKGFKPTAASFLGYMISHESHHRGQILLTLKQAGNPVDKKTAFGIWEWGVR